MKWMRGRKICFIALAILVVLILFFLLHKNGTAVYVGGEQMGILKTRSVTAEEITETIESQLKGILGTEVQLKEEITTEAVRINGSNEKDVCTEEYLYPKIRNSVSYLVDAAVIMVDAEAAVVLPTQEQAQSVLDQMQAMYLPDNAEELNIEASFVEQVAIEKQFVDSSQIQTEEEAIEALNASTDVTKTYTVQSGDSLYLIAQNAKMSLEDLLELNGLQATSTIRVGDVLKITAQKPMLSVKTVETVVLTTIQEKTYEYQYDDTKPSTYQKVLQQGRDGQKESTMQIIRINGSEEEKKEISYVTTVEPVTEIILKGTA